VCGIDLVPLERGHVVFRVYASSVLSLFSKYTNCLKIASLVCFLSDRMF